jgi:hypothetical protein
LRQNLLLRAKIVSQSLIVGHVIEGFRLGFMGHPALELVKRAYVVDVDVRGDSKNGFAGRDTQLASQVTESHAKIDDKIGVPANDVKHVGPEEPMDMRFAYPGQSIRGRFL